MQNFKLKISYDGGAYLGWQKTNAGPSIEESLQTQIEKILQHSVKLQSASRTDAGVHSNGQVINFFTEKLIDSGKLLFSLNQLLPKDIRALSLQRMPHSFHPSVDCIAKEYHYFICLDNVQLPQHRHYSWHMYYPISRELIRDAIPFIQGSHSFKSFCNQHNHLKDEHFIRELHSIEMIELESNRLCFKIKGNRFLYKMVRNLVGTLIYIGRGLIRPQDILNILEEGDRKKAGITAPAHGLFLHEIFYK